MMAQVMIAMGQTGVAAGIFAANSHLVGNPTRNLDAFEGAMTGRCKPIRLIAMDEAEDVEKCLEPQGSFHRQDRRSLWARARVLMEPA
jgi:hypothetical protein